MPLAVLIVSGGLDSVVLAHKAHDLGYSVHMLSFDYGQRHKKELDFAAKAAKRLGAVHGIVDMSGLRDLLAGSALTSDIPVPEGHYTAPSMSATVVPNRNAIMLSIAYGLAVSRRASLVGTAIHAGDHAIYPDCRPNFARAFDLMEGLATEGYGRPDLSLWTPFVHSSKTDIVRWGHELSVPFAETWSCYKGGEIHCGACGTCYERREAFRDAGVTDPTAYEATPELAHA